MFTRFNKKRFQHWLIDYRHAWLQLDHALTRAEQRLLTEGREADANSVILEMLQLAERAGATA